MKKVKVEILPNKPEIVLNPFDDPKPSNNFSLLLFIW